MWCVPTAPSCSARRGRHKYVPVGSLARVRARERPGRALHERTAGTNCDRETAHAFELAGAECDFVHINRILENRSLLEVSQGIGLAFLLSARSVSRDHVFVPYREDWKPLRDEGFEIEK